MISTRILGCDYTHGCFYNIIFSEYPSSLTFYYSTVCNDPSVATTMCAKKCVHLPINHTPLNPHSCHAIADEKTISQVSCNGAKWSTGPSHLLSNQMGLRRPLRHLGTNFLKEILRCNATKNVIGTCGGDDTNSHLVSLQLGAI